MNSHQEIENAKIKACKPIGWDNLINIFGYYPDDLLQEYTIPELITFADSVKTLFPNFSPYASNILYLYDIETINFLYNTFLFFHQFLYLSDADKKSIENDADYLNQIKCYFVINKKTNETILHMACRFIEADLIHWKIAETIIKYAELLKLTNHFCLPDFQNKTILYWAAKIGNLSLYTAVKNILILNNMNINYIAKMPNWCDYHLPIDSFSPDCLLLSEEKRIIYTDLLLPTVTMLSPIRPLSEMTPLEDILKKHKDILLKQPELIEVVLLAYASMRFAKSIIKESSSHLSITTTEELGAAINTLRDEHHRSTFEGMMELIRSLRLIKKGNCEEFSVLVNYYVDYNLLYNPLYEKIKTLLSDTNIYELQPGDHIVVKILINQNCHMAIDAWKGDIFLSSPDEIINNFSDYREIIDELNIPTTVYKILIPCNAKHHKLEPYFSTVPTSFPKDDFPEINPEDLKKDREQAELFLINNSLPTDQKNNSNFNSGLTMFKKLENSSAATTSAVIPTNSL